MARPPSPDWLAIYHREILPRLELEVVFGPLKNARMHGERLRAACPLHGGRNRSFSVRLADLAWHCHSKCGVGGGPLEFLHYAKGHSGPARGRALLELIRELGARVGVTVEADVTQSTQAHEVKELWAAARPVTQDARVARWLLTERGLDPELLVELDLIRVLSPDVAVPRWAAFRRNGGLCSWPAAGYRAIVPLFDGYGRLCSLRFRAPQQGSKGRSAIGLSGVGLVMADAVARAALQAAAVPSGYNGTPFKVVVAEGEPDFLSWASEPARRGLGEGALSFPAVLGVVSGSFDRSVASRLPSGTRVISAMHRDQGGDRIHAGIARALAEANRSFSLTRWNPEP